MGISAAAAATYTIVNHGRVLGKAVGINLRGDDGVVNLGAISSSTARDRLHGTHLGAGDKFLAGGNGGVGITLTRASLSKNGVLSGSAGGEGRFSGDPF